MKKILFGLLFMSLALISFSQYTPSQLVQNAKSTERFKQVSFTETTDRSNVSLPDDLTDYQLFNIDKEVLRQMLRSEHKAITFELSANSRKSLQLELVEIDLPAFTVTEAPSMQQVKYQGGKHYRGIVKGDNNSIAAISIFGDKVMGLISESRSEGNWVFGKLEDSDQHIMYNDPQIQDHFTMGCETEDTYIPYDRHQVLEGPSGRALTDCVGFYFEVDYDIYQSKGSSTTNTTDYITGLYNQVATLYAAEQINTNISQIIVWTQTSPYSGSTSLQMLNSFTANTGSFNGDLAMLLSYQASGGIAYVNGLCASNVDYRKSFSSIDATYQNVPTYSWSVMVVTHEFGHLLGSQHTHACVWNGNNTAIDGCYTVEGNCPDPGIPSGGGTVMSYCHLTSVGINLNNGFGPQPGNVIRNGVTNANCLQACNNPPPPPPPTCTDNQATLNILLDNYPGETTWTIKNSSGTILYSGGPYSSAGTLVSIDICEPDGCYDFTINDSYGDGICCAYGNGYYEVVFNNNVLINGGQFGSTETKQFCLSGGGNPPTCTDGVQNGDETGVDCGGSTCPACPTCTDGVQNGDETGVDCGGSNCPACPTCNDGVQNGDETGVDCGGSTCPACPTCTDGVQNGDETGVDCGGSSCPACPTCNDGIQNGDETGVDCGGSCPPCGGGCSGTEVTISITLDNYPGETTWNLKDANGATLASGGPYSTAGATVSEVVCLSNGCYDFTINDSYGDGICCAYGNGSYSVFSGATTYASGGQFGSTETTNFCIGSPPPPTCTDGVQNGDETGVDCGGSSCPACPTCNDGIQNGDETGVDCGGSTCPPCGGGGSVTIDANYFETGWDGWIDGGSDCYRLDNSSVAFEGNYSIRLRDNSGPASTMTSQNYDLTPYNNVEFEFHFYANSMETGEDFYVQYYDGSSWSTLGTYVSGTHFNNNTFYVSTLTVNGATQNLATNSKFRITCDASANSDQVYIDAITITGNSGSNLLESLVKTRSIKSGTIIDNDVMTLTPNPTSSHIMIDIYDEEEEIGNVRELEIFDMMGRRVMAMDNLENIEQVRIDVSNLTNGAYIIKVNTDGEEIIVDKFQVMKQ